jgi:hypothetical protein
VIAIVRDGSVIPNPKSGTVFTDGDRVGLIGEAEQIAHAEKLFFSTLDPHDPSISTPFGGTHVSTGEP